MDPIYKFFTGLLFAFIFVIVMSYVYLNREKYANQTQESRQILRLFGASFSGIAATLLFDGSIQIGSELADLTFSAAGGIGLFIYVNERWNKLDANINTGLVEKIIDNGIEDKAIAKLSDEFLNQNELSQFSHHMESKTFTEAIHIISTQAKEGDKKAIALLFKIEKQLIPDIGMMIKFFKNRSKNNSLLARLTFIDRDLKSANEFADKALVQDQSNKDMFFIKIAILERQGQEKKARSLILKRIVTLKSSNNVDHQEELANLLSYLAHLTDNREASDQLWSESANLYKKLGDTDGQAKALVHINDSQELAQSLGDFIDDTATKALLFRHKADVDLQAEEYDIALAGYRKANKIDKHVGNIDGIYSNYRGIAEVFLKSGELDLAEKNAKKALKASEESKCWLAVRSNFLLLANVAKAKNDITKMGKYIQKAQNISELVGDKKAVDFLSNFKQSETLIESGKSLGILDDNGEPNIEAVDFLFSAIDKFGAGSEEKAILRLKPWYLRSQLLLAMADKTTGLFMSATDAANTFKKLGFSDDPLDVDYEEFKSFQKKLGKKFKQFQGIGIEKINEMQNIRKFYIDKLEKSEDSQGYFFIYACLLRLGFDLDDASIIDEKAYDVERIILLQSEHYCSETPIGFALEQWAQAMSILVDKEEKNQELIEGAQLFLHHLGVEDNPCEITIEKAEDLFNMFNELKEKFET